MADIAKLGDKLMEQLVGNVNTLFIGKTNEKVKPSIGVKQWERIKTLM